MLSRKSKCRSNNWLKNDITASGINAKDWTTQEWLHFLTQLPADIGAERMAELDKVFNLTTTRQFGNRISMADDVNQK